MYLYKHQGQGYVKSISGFSIYVSNFKTIIVWYISWRKYMLYLKNYSVFRYFITLTTGVSTVFLCNLLSVSASNPSFTYLYWCDSVYANFRIKNKQKYILIAHVERGEMPKQGFGGTNKRLRREITDDLLPRINHISDVKHQQRDSIVTSEHFHIDTKKVGNFYKVDIQYRMARQGSTVAQVFVYDSAKDVNELRYALTKSLQDGYIWVVK